MMRTATWEHDDIYIAYYGDAGVPRFAIMECPDLDRYCSVMRVDQDGACADDLARIDVTSSGLRAPDDGLIDIAVLRLAASLLPRYRGGWSARLG